MLTKILILILFPNFILNLLLQSDIDLNYGNYHVLHIFLKKKKESTVLGFYLIF